ncbi:MAG: DoxX family protein [Pseudomonadota bacterium]
MNSSLQKYGLLAIKALLTAAFVAAGLAKLAGVEMMVQTFEAVGVGQWLRYVTGAIEVVGAALLWVSGRQGFGAALLTCTMAGAVLAHLFIIGPSAVPALILGLLSAVVAYTHRNQFNYASFGQSHDA